MTPRNCVFALLTVLVIQLGCGGTKPVKDAQPSPESSPPAEVDPVEADSSDLDSSEKEYGKFVRYELVSAKPEEAAKFYTALFGWTTEAVGDRWSLQRKGTEVARIRMHDPAGNVPAGWMSWISVQNLDELMRDVPANDGEVLTAPHDGDGGRQAIIKGPTGGVFGIAQLTANADPDRAPEAGDFMLSQLWTEDFAKARSFYTVIGDYTSIEVNFGETTYSVLRGERDTPRALIRLAPKGQTNRWVPFVRSADVDASVEQAKSLGGKVITAPRDITTIGRVAVIEAPTGGVFGLIAPSGWGESMDE